METGQEMSEPFRGAILKADTVRLLRDGSHICALVGIDLVQGIGGFGLTVPDALRDLADELVENGIWVQIEIEAE